MCYWWQALCTVNGIVFKLPSQLKGCVCFLLSTYPSTLCAWRCFFEAVELDVKHRFGCPEDECCGRREHTDGELWGTIDSVFHEAFELWSMISVSLKPDCVKILIVKQALWDSERDFHAIELIDRSRRKLFCHRVYRIMMISTVFRNLYWKTQLNALFFCCLGICQISALFYVLEQREKENQDIAPLLIWVYSRKVE